MQVDNELDEDGLDNNELDEDELDEDEQFMERENRTSIEAPAINNDSSSGSDSDDEK